MRVFFCWQLNVLQNEHELEMSRVLEERAAFLTDSSNTELQGQVYTQQMVITHLKNRLKQMEELKNEVTLLRAERDHLEESLSAVNQKMCYLQNAQSPESNQYKTLLAKLETLEKNQEIREQKLNAVRELLSRSTQGQGQCSGTCRDKLLDKNRQICYYRAQMDRILEALLELRRTK
ncbi:hypothetical protein J6590_055281 [Homalodisca vitripennis]|nr:hypothetical protein J6590_055281 [Homalodisca vitripennis]